MFLRDPLLQTISQGWGGLAQRQLPGLAQQSLGIGGFAEKRIRTVAELTAGGSFGQHVYGLEHLYDLNGRRTDLVHPAQLRAGTARDAAP